MTIGSAIGREIDLDQLVRGVAAILPNAILYLWTGSLVWFEGALVTMSLLIVLTRAGPSLGLLLLHGLVAAAFAALFYLTIPSRFWFVIVCAVTGYLSLHIVRYDETAGKFRHVHFHSPSVSCLRCSIDCR
jgi:hypothetical protein